MHSLVDIANQYFMLTPKGKGAYQIVNPTGEFDTIVIFQDTNTYFRFSTREAGGIREFLHKIIGKSYSEIEEEYGDVAPNKLALALSKSRIEKIDTGLALQDIVGEIGYNEYIASRNVTEETAKCYKLEVKNSDVIIPLTNEMGKRTGSLVRNSHPQNKGLRYRTYMAGKNVKPSIWPYTDVLKLEADSVIILVEGAWSVMRIAQVIKPYLPKIVPLATLGTNLPEELFTYIGGFSIIAILDVDKGGETVSEQLIQWRIRKSKVEIYEAFRDSNTNASTYVDDLDDEDLKKMFRKIYKSSKFL